MHLYTSKDHVYHNPAGQTSTRYSLDCYIVPLLLQGAARRGPPCPLPCGKRPQTSKLGVYYG
jgi:hypothetical protein